MNRPLLKQTLVSTTKTTLKLNKPQMMILTDAKKAILTRRAKKKKLELTMQFRNSHKTKSRLSEQLFLQLIM